MPLSAGMVLKKSSNASRPPAEAPIPMMGNAAFGSAALFLAARAAPMFFLNFIPAFVFVFCVFVAATGSFLPRFQHAFFALLDHHPVTSLNRRPLSRIMGRMNLWQREPKRRPLPLAFRFRPDLPAMGFDDPFYGGKTNAGIM